MTLCQICHLFQTKRKCFNNLSYLPQKYFTICHGCGQRAGNTRIYFRAGPVLVTGSGYAAGHYGNLVWGSGVRHRNDTKWLQHKKG